MRRILDIYNPINWASPLNNGLMARWQCFNHFNNSGPILYDLVKKNHAILNGAQFVNSNWRSGGYGSLSFDGIDDRLTLVPFVLPIATGSLSIWWCPLESISGGVTHYIFRASINSPIQLFDLVFHSDNMVYFGWYNNGNDDRVAVVKPSVTIGTWYHWYITWINGGATTVYFDGVFLASIAVTDAIWDTSTATTFEFAHQDAPPNCLLDDMRISSQILNPNLIIQDSNRGSPSTLNWLQTTKYFIPLTISKRFVVIKSSTRKFLGLKT